MLLCQAVPYCTDRARVHAVDAQFIVRHVKVTAICVEYAKTVDAQSIARHLKTYTICVIYAKTVAAQFIAPHPPTSNPRIHDPEVLD